MLLPILLALWSIFALILFGLGIGFGIGLLLLHDLLFFLYHLRGLLRACATARHVALGLLLGELNAEVCPGARKARSRMAESALRVGRLFMVRDVSIGEAQQLQRSPHAGASDAISVARKMRLNHQFR